MNKHRRERIQALIETLEGLTGVVEELRDEEQDFFDNMPENIQQGEKGEQAQEAASCLDSAVDNLTDLLHNLEEAAE